MDFSLDARTARLSVGEFSSFKLGPHAAGSSSKGQMLQFFVI